MKVNKFLVGLVVVFGCGGGADENPETNNQNVFCTPGQQVECSCSGGVVGVQTCLEDGSGLEECVCESSSTTTVSTSSVGGGGGGDGGSTSSGGGSGGSGGEGCVPTVTCGSLQAECGEFTDDCGNKVTCPDNCSGFNTCGGGGDQFKCGCTPKDCNDLGYNCGEADDGCGGKIQCGECGDDPYVECGGKMAPNPDGTFSEPTPNTCNGGCTWIPSNNTCGIFEGMVGKYYLCSYSGNTHFPAGKTKCSFDSYNPDQNGWCCWY